MNLRMLVLVCAASATTIGAQPADEPVQVDRLETVTATVESIDTDTRMVELKSKHGTRTVQVPPEVRNLEQVKVGDQVVVQFYEGLAAQFKKPGESLPIGVVDASSSTARRPEGARPGASAANVVTTTVVIEAVDKPSNSVTFTGPSGMTRTVAVQDPKAREFIGTLKKGDHVELTYTEAVAVTVEPQQKQQEKQP
jgi:hypothetical protein